MRCNTCIKFFLSYTYLKKQFNASKQHKLKNVNILHLQIWHALEFSQSMRIINPKFAVTYRLLQEFYDNGELSHLDGILIDLLILLGR